MPIGIASHDQSCYCIAGFLCFITYFRVNYLLGGMHSYA